MNAATGFAADYLAQLERFAGRVSLPRVRALHLPPLARNTDDRGEFCAVELEDGALGLSYVLLGDTLERLHEHGNLTDLGGADALALARHYASDVALERTIGFATANALTNCLYKRAGFQPPSSADSIGGLQPAAGEHIGMIGLFRPLLGRIVDAGATLTVVELRAELAGAADGYRVTTDASALAGCTQVLSTSTLLLNDTLDRMLAHCRQARRVALIGPSAGCLPDALFARGVSFLGGSWVTDPPAFLDALRSGTRSKSACKSGLTRDTYPGFESLLARL